MSDIWVDFNDVDKLGRTVTLSKHAEPGVDLSIGSSLVAGDYDGNRCMAVVRDVGGDGVVSLVLDIGSLNKFPDYSDAGASGAWPRPAW